MTVAFRVYGVPRPQGSKRALPTKSGRPIMVESSGSNLKTWRGQVAAAVRDNRPSALLDGPVGLAVTFYLPPPKRPRWWAPAKVPDVSKLARAIEDELSGTVIVDDRLIIDLCVRKRWSSDGEPPGADVRVYTMEEPRDA